MQTTASENQARPLREQILFWGDIASKDLAKVKK